MNSFEVSERKVGNFTLRGGSVAARYTGFHVPEWNIMLDAGNPALRHVTVDALFITHAHTDHTGETPWILLNAGKSGSKLTVYCPKSIAALTRNYIDAHSRLSKEIESPLEPKIHNKYELVAVEPGMEIPFRFDEKEAEKRKADKIKLKEERKAFRKAKRKGEIDPEASYPTGGIEKKKKRATCNVEVIKCYHTTDESFGYGFIEIRRKLKTEYHGRSQAELNKLVSEGVEINHEVKFPVYCFLGDTNERVLYAIEESGKLIFSPILEKYKYIVIECTFLFEGEMELAVEHRHMHWSKLEPYVRAHPDTKFILIHFSARYSVEQISKFFNDVDLPNVEPFLPCYRHPRPSIKISKKGVGAAAPPAPLPAAVPAGGVAADDDEEDLKHCCKDEPGSTELKRKSVWDIRAAEQAPTRGRVYPSYRDRTRSLSRYGARTYGSSPPSPPSPSYISYPPLPKYEGRASRVAASRSPATSEPDSPMVGDVQL
ncbi:MAG: beta-lactamase superfamily domain [Hyperionvirus sp.]|uniref:Beta-lactamase superfamily domain n=1 Tax=Hyperionvirus sp. TaxID=2487770 RepID=A0A3G5ADT2_9VIRU|nr:MAG: beta-lactamase superfamily domain [Hyperionvirus sp.]